MVITKMTKSEIIKRFEQLNQKLAAMNVKGEICLYGGAVMCVVFNARPSTKDVDAVFEPSRKIREAARQIAKENDLNEDWLNDAVKGFLEKHEKTILFVWDHLTVYYADPDYLLAMKAMSARIDSTDNQDIRFLIRQLNIQSPEEIFTIIEKYYRKNRIKPATQFFIEEIFENGNAFEG